MSCRDSNNRCDEGACGYLDIIHFQHRSRHYESGGVSGAWCHHPINEGISFPFTGSPGKQTNFLEFTGDGQEGYLDPVANLYWIKKTWCIGQHPIGFMDEMLEELGITLTPDEDRLLDDCDLLLYYITEQIWTHGGVASVNGLDPTIHCVLTDAGKGTLVRELWSQPMNQSGYIWKRSYKAGDCDSENPLVTNRNCVWRDDTNETNQIIQYPNTDGIYYPRYRQYFAQSMMPSRDRVAFIGPPSGKYGVGDENVDVSDPVVFGYMVQIRNTFTGELLFDGIVESEAAIPQFSFGGSEYTCGTGWCPPDDPPPETVEEEISYVPTALFWAVAFGDTSLLACMATLANRDDWAEIDPEMDDVIWSPFGSLRLVTLHQSADNDFILTESNRSPLGFVPNTTPPAASPSGLLWVSGFDYTYGVDPTDEEFSIRWGIYEVGMGSVSAPIFLDDYEDMVGTPSIWCESLYTLINGGSRVDPGTGEITYPFFTKRVYIPGSAEPDELAHGFNYSIGYYGWSWGFWDSGYFDWNDGFWSTRGFGYEGWGGFGTPGIGCSTPEAACVTQGWGPLNFYQYVVGDYTPGGDLEKITFRPPNIDEPGVKQPVADNPCRETCHDNDISGDDDGCGGCDCEGVELEIDIGDPDCYGRIPITVTCHGCGSRNENDPHHFQWNTANLAYVGDECVSLGPSHWQDGICGQTFFIQAGEAGVIEFRYGRCGCGFYTCMPLPAWECPLSVSGPTVVTPEEESTLGFPTCWGLDGSDPCYADWDCKMIVTSAVYYKLTVEVLCDDPPTPEISLEWSTSGKGEGRWCGGGAEGILIQESANTWSYYKCGHWANGHNILACGEDDEDGYVAMIANVRLPDICSYTSTTVYSGSAP